MVVASQGDIIKLSFDPTLGHEQAAYRPAVVISNDSFIRHTGFMIILPITNTDRDYPLHVLLDHRTQTTGFILCEHIKSIDSAARPYKIVESLPKDILVNVMAVVAAELKLG